MSNVKLSIEELHETYLDAAGHSFQGAPHRAGLAAVRAKVEAECATAYDALKQELAKSRASGCRANHALVEKCRELEARPTLGSAMTDEQVEAAASAIEDCAPGGAHELRVRQARAALSAIVIAPREVTDSELHEAYNDCQYPPEPTVHDHINGLRAVLALGNGVYPDTATQKVADIACKNFQERAQAAEANAIALEDKLQRAEKAEARIAELEKERDDWRETAAKHAALEDEALRLRDEAYQKIAELTRQISEFENFVSRVRAVVK